VIPKSTLETLPLGKAQVLQEGTRVAILAFGSMVGLCRKIAEPLGATLVNMRFVKPLDTELVKTMANRHELLVTVEENAVLGGAGSGVCEALSAMNLNTSILTIGIPDLYIEHGARDDCLETAGLSQANVLRQIRARMAAMGLSPSVASNVTHRLA
jgi:1-deoxy-D-xylulose-5-phosphate synthase